MKMGSNVKDEKSRNIDHEITDQIKTCKNRTLNQLINQTSNNPTKFHKT